MQHNDIEVVKGNTKGRDFIVGDLHGNRNAFQHVMAALKTNDRIFIAGDLVDRGEDSPGLIAAIIEDQRQNPGRIQIIRGNHENITLDCISAYETLLRKRDSVSRKDIHNAEKVRENHLVNGGQWLNDLFTDEFAQGKISLDENGKVTYAEDSQVRMTRDFMASLPTIIHVEGNKPFNVVHADMPISQEELKNKIRNKDFKLTEKQKDYAIWARKDEFISNNRDENSTITYVGHNIIGEGKYSVVRSGNTVNLDVAAYKNDVSLMANHTEGRCEFVGKNADDLTNTFLLNAKKQLTSHLKRQSELAKRREEARFAEFVKNVNLPDLPMKPLPKTPPRKPPELSPKTKVLPAVDVSETSNEAASASEKSPEAVNIPQPREKSADELGIFVVVIGGTGETLTEDQKNIGSIFKKKNDLKNEMDVIRSRLEELKSKFEKLLDEKRSNEDAQNEIVEDKSDTEFSDFTRMLEGLDDPEIIRVQKEVTQLNSEVLAMQIQYHELDKKYNDIRESLIGNIHNDYFPSEESLRHCNLVLLEGTHTPGSLKYEQDVENKQFGKAAIQGVKDTYDLITAKSEKKRIRECMEKLEELEQDGKLPKRMVLNGHSRGASTCIEMARAIYLQYGDAIKIDMNISDPVPGPLRHGKTKKVIPPNVEALAIVYTAKENKAEFRPGKMYSFFEKTVQNKIFKPQNLHKIFYDKDKTTVTSLVLPTKHVAPGKGGYLAAINRAFWDAVINKTEIKEDPLKLTKAYGGYSVGQEGMLAGTGKLFSIAESKSKRIGIRMQDKEGDTSGINQFNQWVTGGDKTLVKQVAQHPVTNIEKPAETTDVKQTHQQVLDSIYNKGREELRQKREERRNSFKR